MVSNKYQGANFIVQPGEKFKPVKVKSIPVQKKKYQERRFDNARKKYYDIV